MGQYQFEQAASLIFDRTEEDVERVRYLTRRVCQIGIDALSEEERKEWLSELKGAYNYIDLNRVEKMCEQLSGWLIELSYPVELVVKTNWEMRDFPTHEELERIRKNIKNLCDVFFIRQNTPEIPRNLNRMDIEKANALEKILYDLYLVCTAIMEMTPQIAGFELGGV